MSEQLVSEGGDCSILDELEVVEPHCVECGGYAAPPADPWSASLCLDCLGSDPSRKPTRRRGFGLTPYPASCNLGVGPGLSPRSTS